MKALLPRPQPAATASAASAAAARRLLKTSGWQTQTIPIPIPTRAQHFSTSRRRSSPPTALTPSAVSAQAMPRGAYYDILLTNPPPYASTKVEGPPVTAHPEEKKTKANEKEFFPRTAPLPDSPQDRARIIFGSRLAGPMERESRLAEIRKRSQMVAGVMVPPKPEEPENCCMSGCVNCVWDRFRDEMEEWAAASTEASHRLKAQEPGASGVGAGSVSASVSRSAASTADYSVSMDDDGGGSNTNWSLEEAGKADGGKSSGASFNSDLYKSIPVGIREFMRQEKRLKLKHMQQGTAGG